MDLYVEKQCVEQMKQGNMKQFLLLFEANFRDLYEYVARRVNEREEVERIVRLTFLDAVNRVQDTPEDSNYIVWLYSLAKPRVWSYINQSSFPQKQGLMALSDVAEAEGAGADEVLQKFEKMVGKLSMEEREILRLKFFEEVTDGDVLTVLGGEESTVGQKIYRVMKRAHFLLFGEGEERQGAYFGEVSGFLEQIREMENIEVPESFKLSLKADLSAKIDKKDFAVDGEEVKSQPVETPWAKPEAASEDVADAPSGSNDPAKVFVNAVKEMREEEEEKLEREEAIMEFFDRWKFVFALVPAILLVAIVGFVLWKFLDFGGGEKLVERGYPTDCEVEIEYEGEFYDGLRRSVDPAVADRLCNHFEVASLKLIRGEEGEVDVELTGNGDELEYTFKKRRDDWRVAKYAKIIDSNQE